MNQVFFVRQKGISYRLNVNDIVFLEALGKYTSFKMRNRTEVFIRCSISKAVELLKERQMIQISRSCAVPLKYIELIDRDSVQIIIEQDVVELPLDKAYRVNLIKNIVILGTTQAGLNFDDKGNRILEEE